MKTLLFVAIVLFTACKATQKVTSSEKKPARVQVRQLDGTYQGYYIRIIE